MEIISDIILSLHVTTQLFRSCSMYVEVAMMQAASLRAQCVRHQRTATLQRLLAPSNELHTETSHNDQPHNTSRGDDDVH
eukprot:scaffold6414_cov105-Skeletonema_dohrnii-CCMP3373.AAC.1